MAQKVTSIAALAFCATQHAFSEHCVTSNNTNSTYHLFNQSAKCQWHVRNHNTNRHLQTIREKNDWCKDCGDSYIKNRHLPPMKPREVNIGSLQQIMLELNPYLLSNPESWRWVIYGKLGSVTHQLWNQESWRSAIYHTPYCLFMTLLPVVLECHFK